MGFSDIVDHFTEYQDYLVEANDAIKDIFHKIASGFRNGDFQNKLGGFMK